MGSHLSADAGTTMFTMGCHHSVDLLGAEAALRTFFGVQPGQSRRLGLAFLPNHTFHLIPPRRCGSKSAPGTSSPGGTPSNVITPYEPWDAPFPCDTHDQLSGKEPSSYTLSHAIAGGVADLFDPGDVCLHPPRLQVRAPSWPTVEELFFSQVQCSRSVITCLLLLLVTSSEPGTTFEGLATTP